MMFSVEALLLYSMGYGVCMGSVMPYLVELSKKDKECRYADPREWRSIWLLCIVFFIILCTLLLPIHPDWIFGSLIWIVIVYLLAKIPGLKIMGGQDARVLISAGLLFPHWFTIPVAYIVGLLAMAWKKRKLTEEEREDWKARGIPMVPFFSIGWAFAGIFFALVLCLY